MTVLRKKEPAPLGHVGEVGGKRTWVGRFLRISDAERQGSRVNVPLRDEILSKANIG